jgi:hypothetical protein
MLNQKNQIKNQPNQSNMRCKRNRFENVIASMICLNQKQNRKGYSNSKRLLILIIFSKMGA